MKDYSDLKDEINKKRDIKQFNDDDLNVLKTELNNIGNAMYDIGTQLKDRSSAGILNLSDLEFFKGRIENYKQQMAEYRSDVIEMKGYRSGFNLKHGLVTIFPSDSVLLKDNIRKTYDIVDVGVKACDQYLNKLMLENKNEEGKKQSTIDNYEDNEYREEGSKK